MVKKQDRFGALLSGATTSSSSDKGSQTTEPAIGDSPAEFWNQFDKNGPEATDRLNVEIRRSLHEKLKLMCTKQKVTKREAIEALIEWALRDDL